MRVTRIYSGTFLNEQTSVGMFVLVKCGLSGRKQTEEFMGYVASSTTVNKLQPVTQMLVKSVYNINHGITLYFSCDYSFRIRGTNL